MTRLRTFSAGVRDGFLWGAKTLLPGAALVLVAALAARWLS